MTPRHVKSKQHELSPLGSGDVLSLSKAFPAKRRELPGCSEPAALAPIAGPAARTGEERLGWGGSGGRQPSSRLSPAL